VLKLFSFFFICILAVCGNSVSQKEGTTLQNESTEQNQQLKPTNQNQQKAGTELTVRMERFSWTHRLIYKVEIQNDGKIIFEGTEFTKTKEKAESKLEKEKIQQLLTEIETSDFFSLDSAYGYRFKNCPSAMSDNESVKIHIKLNGQEKTINHDLGCLDMSSAELKEEINRKDRIFPQELYKLENKIDEIVETKRWIGERK
jgi:Domain of unknown function (DUF6438)